MKRRYDPQNGDYFEDEYDGYDPYDQYDTDSDPYDHLMDDVDALLEEDAYTGPQQPRNFNNGYGGYDQSGYGADYEAPRPQRQQRPPQQRQPSQQRPTQPSIYAYNADFERQSTQRRRQTPPQKSRRPQNQAQAYEHERTAPRKQKPPKAYRKKRRHPILKFLLALLLLLVIVCGALWIFARQPVSEDSIGVRKDGCATILLAGTDADGMRTDTMMLLYLDSKNGQMNLLSLPRDTYTSADLSVPKLNSIYGVNGGGEVGMEALLDYVKQCIGYRPDGYILVDLDCFADLVNVMGGVEFDVPMDMQYEDPTQDLYIDLKAGLQKLNGEESMWVVRYRSGYALADLQRVQVQRDFIQAAMEQWSKPTKFIRYPAAATLLASNTTTNLSLRNLVWIGKAVLAAKGNGMNMATLPGEAAMISGGSYYVIWPETTANLINESFNPYAEYITKENIYSPWY